MNTRLKSLNLESFRSNDYRGLLESMIDAIPDMFFRVDYEGVYLSFKAENDADLAVAADQILGRKISDIFPAEFAAQGLAKIREAIDVQKLIMWNYDLRLNGLIRKFEARISPTAAKEAVVIVRDVTEEFLSKARLIEATKAAENANQMKTMFLANMSHELRTPLTSIIGFSDLLYSDAVEEKNLTLAADLEKIFKAGKHLLSLINNILDIAKIESGEFDLDNQDRFLHELLDEVLVTMDPATRKNNNKLEIMMDFQIDCIKIDGVRLKQNLMNLLGNSFKFTKNGVITLKVSESPTELNFSVIDTGIGIPADKIEKILQPFSQADASTHSEFGGTGLGLTLVNLFTQKMGGRLTIESTPGKGSCFSMVFPKAALTVAP